MPDIQEFRDGRESVRTKLNELVHRVNALWKMQGDQFVGVNIGAGGVAVSLNLATLLPRIPKPSYELTIANITNVSSGNFGFQSPAGQWIYTGDIVGGLGNITLRNTFEVTSYIDGKYRHGTGVEINPATGKLAKGDCTIIPIGIGVIVPCWPDPDSPGNWTFAQPNSAE